ncbi:MULTISPECIES: UvrD-helicase domain-containing protein [Ralstonia]|jgi:hypothetical protein|uniref:UvrD-like helicase ATP-binding domain-containing protein n=1 Tax=Ralstonia pickettii OR214 TaxID=1264675 RepID=R0CPC7_RALPI|nr:MULTISPECIES: UvrD-helicase domain-containing protein [Ralstonia]ENZ78290.1 hypothetical protein OR214_01704 [Ralstonia pickettii OR214]MCM3580828.1 UvrD-helicase domain-containing protein [Ralstonia pickettii]MDR9383584.1 UvrD-helicase domain-containing protein [Ralstonia sp. 11b]MEA3269610.1 UvrD-helicase domain-containing protein [Pseudomonadota bacterium]
MSPSPTALQSKANPQQLEAILATDGPVLIIAGPGSGKTFTLVERIVYLITHKGVAPESLLVVTFTDKAARELTTRISNRLAELDIQFNLNEMYLGTFHSICLRLLEDYREFTRLKRSFTLFDQFDQQYFLYQHIKDFRELPDAELVMGDDQTGRWAQSENLLKWLNKVGEEALDATSLAAAPEPEIRALATCFAKYQELLHEHNSLDFSGIQYEALQLLEKRPEVLGQLRDKLTGQKVSRMHLYYTGEDGGNPYVSFTKDDRAIGKTIARFDDIVARIEQQDYPTQKPEALVERIIKASSNPGDIVFDCFMGSGTAQAVAMKLGRRFIGADINQGAIQTTTKRLVGIGDGLRQQSLGGEERRFTGFEIHNVNHYDVFRNPVQARELLLEALEVQKLEFSTVFDGEKDGRMVKIMPVNRIATRADLNELIAGFDYKSWERKQNESPNRPVEKITLVCMGHEPDLAAQLELAAKPFKIDVEVVDILRDKADLEFKRDSQAKVAIKKGELRIEKFYANTRTDEFVDIAIESFLKESGELRPEGLLPKLAFFAATIDELTSELRPAVERALLKHGIPTSRILVNVGDDKLTTNDDIREFNRLDTEGSEKQFILLVNKGREGWNCRSLFGVGLFREPKSKVFVLQATMRCLRAIGQAQHTGHVFLSDDNLNTLNDELQQNFRISADELQKTGKDKERVEIRVVEPPVKIKLVRVRKQYQMREKALVPGQTLGIDRADKEVWNTLVEKYRLIETQQDGLTAVDAARASGSRTFDLTSRREKRAFSRLSLVAEVSRYLNRNPLEIEELLDATKEGTDELVAVTNEFNELLYDEIIPRLFRQLYDLDESQQTEEHEVDLIKLPPNGYYEVSAAKDKIVRMSDTQINDEERAKSFHLDTYCFDSGSENWLFWDLLREQRVKKIYFTGMLTHGQSDFFIQYIDPDSRTVRSYYPDFIFQREEPDGSLKYVIVEVKADNQIEDAVVQAKKDFAQQIAVASGMEYRILKSSDADKRHFRVLL